MVNLQHLVKIYIDNPKKVCNNNIYMAVFLFHLALSLANPPVLPLIIGMSEQLLM